MNHPRKRLFEYAILHHPRPENPNEKPDPSTIVKHPTVILAESERDAVMAATLEVPAEYRERLEEVEIAVRPF